MKFTNLLKQPLPPLADEYHNIIDFFERTIENQLQLPAANSPEVQTLCAQLAVWAKLLELRDNVCANAPTGVFPPENHRKSAGHHWLEVLDSDGHRFGAVVAQWNPGARRWSSSGDVGIGLYLVRDTGSTLHRVLFLKLYSNAVKMQSQFTSTRRIK